MTIPVVVYAEGAKIVSDGIQAFKEYKIAKEREITDRERIRGAVMCFCETVRAKRDAFIQELNNSHDRKILMIQLFGDVLKIAVANKDEEVAKQIIGSMVSASIFESHQCALDSIPQLSLSK